MIYLDHGATSFPKPPEVRRAVLHALKACANPGRGGYGPAMEAARTVFRCRERAGRLFGCPVERVVFTGSCTQGLNMAIRTLVRPGMPVVISGFEHNAVVRTLQGLGARITVAGRRLFDPRDTLEAFRRALEEGAEAAVFTHVSNVFGYMLPVKALGKLCREFGVPFVIDAAQSAGSIPLSLEETGADFIAMPGHKGLLGPQGTGLLLCRREPEPLLFGGTGTESRRITMPRELPEGAEPGTLNVPGIAGLSAGLALVEKMGIRRIGAREAEAAARCARGLERLGLRVFSGERQAGVVSFLAPGDCQETAQKLSARGIALRAGLHCAPLAHESAGTLETGTLRASFGPRAEPGQGEELVSAMEKIVTEL